MGSTDGQARNHSSRRSFMGLAARRSAAFAGQVAGVAATISPIARLAAYPAAIAEEPDMLTSHADHVEMLDRRDPTGSTRATIRSTSELLRRAAEGAVVDGPGLAIAVAWGVSLSWQRASEAHQSPADAVEFAVHAVRGSAVAGPAVRVALDRLGQLVGSSRTHGGASISEQLAAEVARFSADVAVRHHSAAEQAARRLAGTPDEPRDVLLIGDGSRLAGGGIATTTRTACLLREAGRLGEVLIARDDDDPLAADWMAADLARVGIGSTSARGPELLGLMTARETLQILLATSAGSPDLGCVVPVGSALAIETFAGRVLAVVSAFGERARSEDLRAGHVVRTAEVVG